MSFSKQEYLEHTVSCVNPKKMDTVLEVAAGTNNTAPSRRDGRGTFDRVSVL